MAVVRRGAQWEESMCSLISPIATLAWQIGHSQKREPGGSLRFIDRQTARLHIRGYVLFKLGFLVMKHIQIRHVEEPWTRVAWSSRAGRLARAGISRGWRPW